MNSSLLTQTKLIFIDPNPAAILPLVWVDMSAWERHSLDKK
jgi:hypothetical protein